MRICSHFGEKPKWERCNACDVCGVMPSWLAEPVAAPIGRRTKKRRGMAAAAGAGASSSFGSGRAGEETRRFREFADDEVATGVDPELREQLLAELAKSKTAQAYMASLQQLREVHPHLWLPAAPSNGQNANLYDSSWNDTLKMNYIDARRDAK